MRVKCLFMLVAVFFFTGICLADSLLVHYSFDGSIADPNLLTADSSGNGYDATVVAGSPVGSTDVPDLLAGGNSWDSPGSADAWMDVDPNLPVPSGDYSIAFWAKPVGSYARMIATSSPGTEGIQLWQRSGNLMRYYHNNAYVITESDAGTVFSDTDWTHVAVTVNISAGEVNLYVDGILRKAKSGLSLSPLGKGLNRIGGRDTGAGLYGYNGKLDDFSFYDYALSLPEVKVLAGVDNTPPTPEAGGIQSASGGVTGFMTVGVGTPLELNGSYTDDGKPAGGTVTTQWSVVDSAQAPNVIFDNPNALVTSVTFDTAGFYTLRLTVNDGEFDGTDDILIRAKDATDALQAHLKFDGDPNDLTDDFYLYTAITGGEPNFVPGKVGKALQLDTNDTILFGKELGAETSISVAMWIQPDPTNGVGTNSNPASKRTGNTATPDQGGWGFEARPGVLYQYCSPGYNNGSGRLSYSTTWEGQWMHVVMTYDVDTHSQVLYVDGVEVASGTSSFTSFDSISDLQVGSAVFSGLVDDMYIYDYVIDAAQIRTLFTEGGNAPPVVTIDVEQAKIILPSNQVTLSGWVQDENGYSVLWTVEESPIGATVTIADDMSESTTATFETAGNYTLRLTATDEGGLTDYKDFVVKVRSATFDGMEAHITFDSMTPENVLSTSVPYIGTLSGGSSYVTDPNRPELGYGLQLDGTGYVTYDKYLGSDENMAVCFWVKPTALGTANSFLLDKWSNDGSGQGWMSEIRGTDNNLGAVLGSSFGAGSFRRYPIELALSTDVWTHVAMTFDGETFRCYQNGALISEGTSGYSPADLSVPLVVGYRQSNGTSYLNGVIDEIRIYDYALSSAQINSIYAADGGGDFNTCFPGLAGDLSGDCHVDLKDVADLGSWWDSIYTITDLATVAQEWLSCDDLNLEECL